MSVYIDMPPVFAGPLLGQVVRIHRMPGHYVRKGDAVVSVRIGIHLLTLCAPFDGKVMKCRKVGDVVTASDPVAELTDVGKPTWELFVAYRRADAPGHAGRVGEGLIGSFGPGQVFKDIEALEPGQDFVVTVRAMLQRAFCMVVIMGPHWADDRRLFDPDDLHREELRTALERNIHILPVLVDGARMPKEELVPEDVRPIVRRQAIEISDIRWDYDLQCTISAVEKVLAASPKRQQFLAQVHTDWSRAPGWQFVVDSPRED
jgi:hypothetical protein